MKYIYISKKENISDIDVSLSSRKDWISDSILCSLQFPCNDKIIGNFEQDPCAAVIVYHMQSGLVSEFEVPKSDLKICVKLMNQKQMNIFIL